MSNLAPYASNPAATRGRLWPEGPADFRTPFQRDRDRIIHSEAFRKLQYKTQVFLAYEGRSYRTRLTHTLEVAQISRSVCRVLKLDEDLGEAIALAHDLGHTPFGHAGERGITRALQALGLPEFDHNQQTLRVVTQLEERYAEFDGLNLSWETLEGLAKHNGPLQYPSPFMRALDTQLDLSLDSQASMEAQVAALADDLAYLTHDVDDGLRSGLLELGELSQVSLIQEALDEVPAHQTPHRLRAQLVRNLVARMVTDLLAETGQRLRQALPRQADAVRAAPRPLVAFSEDFFEDLRELRTFLHARLWRHPTIWSEAQIAEDLLHDLFMQAYEASDSREAEPLGRAQSLIDRLASLTDAAARDEAARAR